MNKSDLLALRTQFQAFWTRWSLLGQQREFVSLSHSSDIRKMFAEGKSEADYLVRELDQSGLGKWLVDEQYKLRVKNAITPRHIRDSTREHAADELENLGAGHEAGAMLILYDEQCEAISHIENALGLLMFTSGDGALDAKITSILDGLRTLSISSSTVDNVSLLLHSLGKVAVQAVQDALYRAAVSESQFQADLTSRLKFDPKIAIELQTHSHEAGGVTDLSFRRIPIELKVAHTGKFSVADCDRYVPQVAAYAVGREKVGILCVLDCGERSQVAVPPAELVELFSDGKVAVCALVIQGNLPKPSSLSKFRSVNSPWRFFAP